MLARNESLLRCFEKADVGHGSAILRFKVDALGSAIELRTEELVPDSAQLSQCLRSVVSTISFEPEARGAEVAYPVRFQRAGTEEAANAVEPAERELLSFGPNPQLFGDDWLVRDAKGRFVSDLELALLAKDLDLHRELEGRVTTSYVVSAVAGVLSVAGFGVGAFGVFKVAEGSDETTHVALAAGGAGVSAVCGVVALYYLARALDASTGNPIWHYLERARAEELIHRTNRE